MVGADEELEFAYGAELLAGTFRFAAGFAGAVVGEGGDEGGEDGGRGHTLCAPMTVFTSGARAARRSMDLA
jgi:hypothetical protein